MYRIVIQYAAPRRHTPKVALLRYFAETALHDNIARAEVTIRIVDVDEMTELNALYRHKGGPTNVLSFPAPDEVKAAMNVLGDIVICADVVNREADEQQKTKEAHWAHITIHGIFHLLGYDHEKDDEQGPQEVPQIACNQHAFSCR